MKHRSSILILIVFGLIGSYACKRIVPDKASLERITEPPPQPVSTINIPLELPLALLEKELNKGLKELVYSDDQLNLGNGISTAINIFREGNIKLTSSGGNRLLVQLPMRLKGNLKLEKQVFGQILSTSIPYDEPLIPEISFFPEIGSDWDLSIKDLKIERWDRSLTLNLLGYEVDFDSAIRKHLENILMAQLSNNGVSKISFRKIAEDTWEAYGRSFKITGNNLNAYIYTIPQKIKINEQLTSDNKLKLNIGLEGKVMTYVGDEQTNPPASLPRLYRNEDASNRLDITWPLAIPYPILDDYLNKELSGKVQVIDRKTKLTPSNIKTESYGERVLIQMDFELERSGKKNLSGELLLVGKPGFDKETAAIVFEDIDFDVNSKNILANSGRWLKQRKLLRIINQHASFPISQYIDQAKSELQKHNYLSTDFASFTVKESNLTVTGIYVTEKDVRIYLNTTGKVEVKLEHTEGLIN